MLVKFNAIQVRETQAGVEDYFLVDTSSEHNYLHAWHRSPSEPQHSIVLDYGPRAPAFARPLNAQDGQ